MIDDGIITEETHKRIKQLKIRAKREFSKGNRDHKYYGSWD